MREIIDVPVTQRDLKSVTAEICTLKQQAQRMAVGYVVEIGRRLKEAKGMVPHGQWGEYLRTEVAYSQSTANNYMAIFDAYAADQMTLCGAIANSQAIANLSYSKALKLIAMPEEERETFVREHDVEEISTRELDKLIRERDTARRQALDAEASLSAVQKDLENARKAEQQAQEQLAQVQESAQQADNAAQEGVKELEEKLADAKEKYKKAKQALQALKDNPEISPEKMEEIKRNAALDAEAAAQAEHERLAQEAERARNAAKTAETEAEKLKKQLALALPETAQFKLVFEQVQDDFNKLVGLILKIEQTDKAQADKLRTAIVAMLQKFGDGVKK